MCLIIQKPANVDIPTDALEQAFRRNGDGVGFMYMDGDAVRTHRAVLNGNFDEFMCIYNRYKDRNLGLHFRMATHGDKNRSNCHPYMVLNRRQHGRDLLLMHNGIISIFELDKHRSDTWHFVHYVLRPLLLAHPELLELEARSQLAVVLKGLVKTDRLLLLDGKAKEWVFLGGERQKELNDCWASNTYWSSTVGSRVVYPYGGSSFNYPKNTQVGRQVNSWAALPRRSGTTTVTPHMEFIEGGATTGSTEFLERLLDNMDTKQVEPSYLKSMNTWWKKAEQLTAAKKLFKVFQILYELVNKAHTSTVFTFLKENNVKLISSMVINSVSDFRHAVNTTIRYRVLMGKTTDVRTNFYNYTNGLHVEAKQVEKEEVPVTGSEGGMACKLTVKWEDQPVKEFGLDVKRAAVYRMIADCDLPDPVWYLDGLGDEYTKHLERLDVWVLKMDGGMWRYTFVDYEVGCVIKEVTFDDTQTVERTNGFGDRSTKAVQIMLTTNPFVEGNEFEVEDLEGASAEDVARVVMSNQVGVAALLVDLVEAAEGEEEATVESQTAGS